MRIALALALLLVASVARAQDRYALEILAPNASLPSGHRMANCYTGLDCVFPVIAVGGEYPYTYALTNAPAGMTVQNASAGETCGITTAALTHVPCGRITWVNPTANASNITITVTDADGDPDSETWSITVGTSGWRFIDDVGGSDSGGSGTGAIGTPWRTVGYAETNSTAGDRWYFRTGTYQVQTEFGTLINPGGSRYQALFTSNLVWLEYPGDAAVIAHEANDTNGTYFATVSLGGTAAFIDGFSVTNCKYFCFINGPTAGAMGPVYFRLSLDHQGYGADEAGSNKSMITYEHTNPQSIGASVIDTTFNDGGLGIKHYDVLKALVHGNHFTNMDAGIEHKDGATQFEDRVNRMIAIGGTGGLYETGINGNQNGATFDVYGVVAYNLITMVDNYPAAGGDEAIMLGWQTDGGTYDAYRNTVVGKVTVYDTNSVDGPFYFTSNVIINDGSDTDKVTLDTVSDPTRVIVSGHVTGTQAAGVVETTYYTLTGANRTTYCTPTCTKGHEINGQASLTGPVRLRFRGEDLLAALAVDLWRTRVDP